MSRLLNAGFKRLINNKLFWACLIILITIGIIGCISQYRNMLEYKIEIKTDTFLFASASMIGIALAVLIPLFVGTDFSDGTIRNKIIVGHSRKSIYFSNLIISVASGFIITAVHMIVMTAIVVTIFGPFKLPAHAIIWHIIATIFLIISYSSIFNMITLLSSSKTVSVVISLLLVFGLMMISAVVLNKLSSEEYINTMSVVDGKNIFETIRNPAYLEGNARKIHQFIVDFIPTGQGFQIMGNIAPNIKILSVYSLIIALISNCIGCFMFNKKDLK